MCPRGEAEDLLLREGTATGQAGGAQLAFCPRGSPREARTLKLGKRRLREAQLGSPTLHLTRTQDKLTLVEAALKSTPVDGKSWESS